MKILSIHADHIEYEATKKAIKSAEEVEKDKVKVKECLVIFTAVEKKDEQAPEKIAEKLVHEIQEIAKQVKAETIVLYPYAHLSNELSNPETAIEVMKKTEDLLKKHFKVYRAPFGWYKSFEIKAKGHPLSELSRSISLDDHTLPDTHKPEEKKTDFSKLIKKLAKSRMESKPAPHGQKSNVELGNELDIYMFSDIIGSGLPLLTSRGAVMKREIERFIIDEEIKRGYEHTSTPVLAKSDLYKVSGHWEHYREFMFSMDVGGESFSLRPMTCPFHFILYKRSPRSYRDLPIRYGEVSNLFRNEKTGELMGLTRMRQFTLTDAHIMCRPDQLEEEFANVLDLIKFLMEKLGITDISYRFSKWDPKNKEKYIDDPKAWESTQKTMKKILDHLKLKYVEAENEAAFYGPKLDLQYNNVYGKEDTLITIQIDFSNAERFDMHYVGEDNKEHRPMVIHRSSAGCTERTIAYLLEKTQGKLPLWLNPVQVKVVTITDRNIPFAKEIHNTLMQLGIRSELDSSTESIGKKVRDAQIQKINYIVTIGDKEVENKTLAIRSRNNEVKFGVSLPFFIEQLQTEIKNKVLK